MFKSVVEGKGHWKEELRIRLKTSQTQDETQNINCASGIVESSHPNKNLDLIVLHSLCP